VLDGNFAQGCGLGTDYPQIHIFQCTLEGTDAVTNEVLEPITFVLAYPPLLRSLTDHQGTDTLLSSRQHPTTG